MPHASAYRVAGGLMERPKRSAEFDHYCRTLRCPRDHKRTMRFLEGSGEVVTDLEFRDRRLLDFPMSRHEEKLRSITWLERLTRANQELVGAVSIPRFRLDSMIECSACGERWPVFYRRPVDVQIIREVSRRRFMTDLGTVEQTVDNSQGLVENKQTLGFEREWTHRMQWSWDRASAISATATVSAKATVHGVGVSADAQRRIEESVKSQLAFSSETKKTTRQTIDVVVPPRTVARVVLTWRQVWEEVECDVRWGADGTVVRVPYQLAIDVIVDHAVRHTQ